MARCRSCEASIIWAGTDSGRVMPLDEIPTAKGNMILINGRTRVATDEDRRLARPMHTSHFATCPDAAKHRKRA